jgi:hypothetical protein
VPPNEYSSQEVALAAPLPRINSRHCERAADDGGDEVKTSHAAVSGYSYSRPLIKANPGKTSRCKSHGDSTHNTCSFLRKRLRANEPFPGHVPVPTSGRRQRPGTTVRAGPHHISRLRTAWRAGHLGRRVGTAWRPDMA